MRKRRVYNPAGGILGSAKPTAPASSEPVLTVSDGALSWEEAAELAILLREQEEVQRRNLGANYRKPHTESKS